MRMTILTIAWALCLTLGTLEAQAQVKLVRQVIGTTGQSVTVGNLKVNYTVGEVAIQEVTTGSLIVREGFQQPEQAGANANDEWLGTQVDYTLFPSPTAGPMTFRLEATTATSLQVRITDLAGREIAGTTREVNQQSNAELQYDLSEEAAGFYLLLIQDTNGNLLRTEKFQKR
ncbi:T9SS type A sorting domain-containing protein [Pontibacter sp. G13]|uniref:T9SS type A sorting domain-containing protein n=1 Tax=Pontibacter sp. G13 TaxID=3074898 RepID=UPI002888FEA8|nr:T9SS type A sorting domain-containing protein [Pontibacter sp. G13]WNJ17637.1 T9SS type A sorting domain-containing protein [Pontibacter sp. G13]